MMMQIDLIPATGAYDSVESTTSSMDKQSAHVLE